MSAPASRKSGLIDSLTGIRGVFCAVVVLVHAAPYAIGLVPATVAFWTPLWHYGYVVLDLFFVLSGFVVSAGYQRTFARRVALATYGRFLWARLSRFYPVHLAVLAALVAAVLAGRLAGIAIPHGGNLGWDLVRQLTLTSGWGGSHALTWNGPAWSLSAEWMCYLLLPLISPAVARLRRPSTVLVAFLAACAIPVVAYSLLGFDDATMTYVMPLPRALGGFLAGATLYRLTQVGSRLPALAGRVTGPLALAAVAACVTLALLRIPTLFALPLCAAVIPALAQQRGRLDAVLSTRTLLRGGELSAAVFLTHVPWLLAASVLITPDRFPGDRGWLGVALLLAGAPVAGWLAYVVVERPAQKWMRLMVGRARRAPARPAVERIDAELAEGRPDRSSVTR